MNELEEWTQYKILSNIFLLYLLSGPQYLTNLILDKTVACVSLSGEQREISWLLSVFKETESDIREGEEQLLLFWLLLWVASSDKESVSFESSEIKICQFS